MLDFLITGSYYDVGTHFLSQIWRNTGSRFTNVAVPGLPGVYYSSAGWGDYNNDGRLDFLISGSTIPGGSNVSQLWRNNLAISNTPPAAPAGLSAVYSNGTVLLHWNAPLDDSTPPLGLSYNLRIGTVPGASDIRASMALPDGRRLLPAMGNIQTTNAVFNPIRLAPGRTYYWSVQAIDHSFAGSPFAIEAQFSLPPKLVNPIRYPDGRFEFCYTNQTALDFDVLVSTNAVLSRPTWINLGPVATNLGGGYYRFTETNVDSQSQRFYQLRAR